jgi:uncharacterized protein
MTIPDYQRAKAAILQRLKSELAAELSYHNIGHTRDDVLPAVERLAPLEGVGGDDLLLLKTAALFHDVGFVTRYFDHESSSIQIAQQMLPDFGYKHEQIEVVCGIIRATRVPQNPTSHLEQIMDDADLDVLGREDFLERNQALRQELVAFGRSYHDLEWYTSQLEFIQGHRYFTAAARTLRDPVKKENIQKFSEILARFQLSQGISAEGPSAETSLLSIPERIAILRGVSLFAQTPDDILEEVASLLTSIDLPGGETIFHKGDYGDCMYIIVRGRISIHDGELVLNMLGPLDVFGEMAILDSDPRVASATAVEETQLLRLAQEPFYKLMAHRTEFARGIIRVLNGHLRGRVRDVAHDFLYIQQVGRITAAAAALEAGVYDSSILDEVGKRSDELGQLARVFQRMADEVQAREKRLKQELMQLRIQIDEVKKAQQVTEITESEYFQELQTKIKRIRKRPENSE